MPELPDVEIAARALRRWTAGARIVGARCLDGYVVRPTSRPAFVRALEGRRVLKVDRKGKWLRWLLSGGGRLVSHLGMTGEWDRAAARAPLGRFERVRIDLSRGTRRWSVRYLDARRFGRLIAASDDPPEWTSLGPDPLADGVDVPRLSSSLRGPRSIKETLMDQSVLAGVGNILATEALWVARIDPRSPGRTLRPGDVGAVARALRRTIARELGARSEAAPAAEDVFFVYGRAGAPCPRCDVRLEKVVLGGRTTAYCPGCQVLRE
jgi:formamidopyrimidine-DNA glycosylase